jgi:hypothetical protein
MVLNPQQIGCHSLQGHRSHRIASRTCPLSLNYLGTALSGVERPCGGAFAVRLVRAGEPRRQAGINSAQIAACDAIRDASGDQFAHQVRCGVSTA